MLSLIVAAFITKNSYTKLLSAPISLNDVLNSTLQIPYNSIILVDDSMDLTVDIFKKWADAHGKELVVSRSRLYGYSRPTRATARQTAIDIFFENFNDEWILFIDDDVIFNDGWWDEAKKYIDEKSVGLIWGVNYDANIERRVLLEALGVDYTQYLIKEFYKRGGTHDTLVRRSALDGIKIPPELHVFEDWYILKYIKEGGYDIRIVKTGVMHYNPSIGISSKQIKEMAFLAAKYAVEPPVLDYAFCRFIKNIVGLPLNIFVCMKCFGVKRGLRRGFLWWRDKFLYRLYFLIYTISLR